jgi:hypothetical protein
MTKALEEITTLIVGISQQVNNIIWPSALLYIK